MHKFGKILCGAILALHWLLSMSSSLAQGGAFPDLQLPAAVSEPQPDAPRSDREALVQVRYTITAEGNTRDIEVIGGFYNQAYADAAIKAVEGWRYEPATIDGESIDWLNNEYTFTFHFPGNEASISPAVRDSYDDIMALVNEDRHQEAITQLESMLADPEVVHTLFDYAFLNDALASVFLADEQVYEALAASIRATTRAGREPGSLRNQPAAEEDFLLTRDLHITALRKRFLLDGTLSHNVEGLKTFERLSALIEIGEDDPLSQQAQAMRERLASNDPMGQFAALTEAQWTYTPVRRIFAIAEARGQIDTIDVLCKRRNAQLNFEVEVEWALPESWGDCTLQFNGSEGAEFTMYEFSE